MKEKITIEICTGTACFVMGGSEILLIEEHLPGELKERVNVKGTLCMDQCELESCERAPFVRINGSVLENATIPSIIAHLKELEKKEQ